MIEGLKAWYQQMLPSGDDPIKLWRERLYLAVGIPSCVFGGIILSMAFQYEVSQGRFLLAAVFAFSWLIIAITLFLPKLPFRLRVTAPIAACWFVGISVFSVYGYESIGPDYMFIFPLGAALLIGFRAAIIALILNFIGFLAVHYASVNGWSDSGFSIYVRKLSVTNWFYLMALFTIGVGVLLRGLNDTIKKERQGAKDLELAAEELTREIEETKRLDQQLRQAQKLKAIGSLAGGIAHDFNNILGIIIGNTELALDELDDEKNLRQDLQEVLNASRRARDLIKQIMTFSREKDQNKSHLNLDTLVKETLHMMRAFLPATIHVQYKSKIQRAIVLANATQIYQVLLNLCTNASQAMGAEGGELTITLTEINAALKEVETPQHLDPVPPQGERFVRISVADTGCGIPEEHLAQIFEPFFTTKAEEEGTGIGLSVVRQIVKNHYGDITVESEPGAGTVFHVILPMIDERVSRAPLPSIPPVSGRASIMFVDDELGLVTLWARILERSGYHVEPHSSSQTALESFRVNPQSFDLIITDDNMPHLTGIKFAEKVHEIHPQMPIILCSGYATALSDAQASELNISRFVPKPFKKNAFLRTINEVLKASQ